MIDELPARLAADSSPLEAVLESGGEALRTTFWVLTVAIPATIDGPRLASRLTRVIHGERQPIARRAVSIASHSIARYAAGSALIAALAGTFIFTASLLLEVPLAAMLAIWAMLWNFVPQIGGYAGGAPFVVLAFVQGSTTGVIALLALLIDRQVENGILQPIISQAVHVSPLASMIAVVLGAATAGIIDAVLATPIRRRLPATNRQRGTR